MNMGEAMMTGGGKERHQRVNTFVYLMVLILSLLLSGIVNSVKFSRECPFIVFAFFRRKEDPPKHGDIRDFRSQIRQKRREQRKAS